MIFMKYAIALPETPVITSSMSSCSTSVCLPRYERSFSVVFLSCPVHVFESVYALIPFWFFMARFVIARTILASDAVLFS